MDVLAIGHFSRATTAPAVSSRSAASSTKAPSARASGRCDGQVFDDVCYSILKEEYFAHPQRFQPQAVKIPKDFEKEG